MTLPGTLLALLLATAPPPGPDRRYDDAILAATQHVAPVYPVPPTLVRAIIKQESAFNPAAVSRAGAIGLMQIMPFNAERLGLTLADLRDPEKNILAGVRLLAVLLEHYKGDIISALIAYNAGPRQHLAPIPRNGETPAYILRILGYYRDYERELGRPLPQPHPPAKATPPPPAFLRPSTPINRSHP